MDSLSLCCSLVREGGGDSLIDRSNVEPPPNIFPPLLPRVGFCLSRGPGGVTIVRPRRPADIPRSMAQLQGPLGGGCAIDDWVGSLSLSLFTFGSFLVSRGRFSICNSGPRSQRSCHRQPGPQWPVQASTVAVSPSPPLVFISNGGGGNSSGGGGGCSGSCLGSSPQPLPSAFFPPPLHPRPPLFRGREFVLPLP